MHTTCRTNSGACANGSRFAESEAVQRALARAESRFGVLNAVPGTLPKALGGVRRQSQDTGGEGFSKK